MAADDLSGFEYKTVDGQRYIRSLWFAGQGGWEWDWIPMGPAQPTGPAAQPPAISVATGIDPSEVANALYGRIIPLSVLGLARIGTAGLIFGPYFSSGSASFAVSFGFPANPAGTRRVYEISLDSKVAWESATGNPEGAIGAGFTGTPFEARFYSGTLTQGADPLEAAMFGAEAVAYRPQMMLWFTNLPLAAYDGKVPFVSAKIGDVTAGAVPGDGINLGEALERIAYSPWLEYDASTFDTSGVADIVQAMILTENQSFLDLLQVTARVYRTLDILQTDKLRINDRGATVTPDVVLHRDHISAGGGVQYTRAEQASVARELELTTIDPDADYVFMASKAVRPLEPVPVTSSTAKDSILLPVVIDATTRASLVTFDKYEEDNARKRISLQTMLYGYALEPGDLFRITDVANDFDNGEVFKVIETSHGANYINEISGAAILKCAISFDDGDPYFAYVRLLLHAETTPPVDSSNYAKAFELQGGAYIDTSIKKYGDSSFRFDGVDDLTMGLGSVTHLNFSPTNTSPYTIECWARFAAIPYGDDQMLVCRNAALIALRLWSLYVTQNTDEITFSSSNDGVTPTASLTTTAANVVVNHWYHIAADKDSTGTIRIYVDGVMKAKNTPTNSVIQADDLVQPSVGCDSGGTGQVPFYGNIDDVRITSVSRYGDLYGDTSFAPPTAQFPDHA